MACWRHLVFGIAFWRSRAVFDAGCCSGLVMAFPFFRNGVVPFSAHASVTLRFVQCSTCSFYLARVVVRLDVFAFAELIIVSIVAGVLCNAYFAVLQHAILTL